MSAQKHLREMKKLADHYDRDVEIRKSGHLALVCRRSERPTVYTSGSANDPRGTKNLIKHLRHHDEA